jgi:hypothetical protein
MMREITFEKPVSEEETRQVEAAYNLGSERERHIVSLAVELTADMVKERPLVTSLDFKPANDEEWNLFALAVRVFVPLMEELRAAETH